MQGEMWKCEYAVTHVSRMPILLPYQGDTRGTYYE